MGGDSQMGGSAFPVSCRCLSVLGQVLFGWVVWRVCVLGRGRVAAGLLNQLNFILEEYVLRVLLYFLIHFYLIAFRLCKVINYMD